MSGTAVLRWTLPSGWYAVSATVLSDAAWRPDLVAAVGGTNDVLERDLDRFAQLSASSAGSSRTWVLVIGAGGRAAHVTAVAWLEIVPATDLADVRRRWEATVEDPPQGLLSRRVVESTVRGRPAVLLLDLAGSAESAESADASVLHERAVGVLHLAERGVNVMVELSTSDLAAFDDTSAMVSELLAHVSIDDKTEVSRG